MREQIRQLSGLEVDVTGIGDQTKVSSVLFWGQEKQQMVLTVALCVLATAVLTAAVALFLIRRRYQAHQKIKNLTESADTEATRDYQDLCRARMATKASAPASEHGKESPKMHPHTITSRDSESSRSSTSSWCEEPVVTNMDISTGHMVLSYMEDHLRNKDRLDQEWQALCAYEAEPSTSTLIASKPENMGKNRYPDVLPYDHSRVVLGSLANATGSDYINASSIADHDPRHPAYIAAQAPVEDSAADFWQLVWEQGSVVLVLLTKLTENGQEMCYRYWPEEGSQLYHIYEVHLVSEHIWCDDYLVRSFYLKNIRSGETRTVTQFHFLSWPQNGVPLSTKALLEFRRKVNKSYRGRSCPIVVHCSDGAGRSGTYCLIDMVLHRMAKGAREIDIAATLEHLRDQRPEAVRTKQQFEFVLTAVAEEVHAILRALPQ
nr:EOG090X01LO [Sida crystallina]